MPSRSNSPFVVRRPDQLRALRSSLRQEIVDAVAGGRASSVRELAAMLGRPADALYYHVRLLQQVGLLRSTGRRHTGAREEEIVDVPGRPIALDPQPRVAHHRDAVQRIVASMLRLTARQHSAALLRAQADRGPQGRHQWASRVSGWFTPAERRELFRTLARLNDLIQGRRRTGKRQLHAFTFALVPLAASAGPESSRRRRQ